MCICVCELHRLTLLLFHFVVQYWEPTKFAAELRHQQDKDLSGPVCLKIDMTAGHFSASDRYKYLSELSFDYAFLLDQLGLNIQKVE